ncbi:MAG: DNA repair protein RecO [Planctomycetes bacterium]|nr:DNA repair protein RecO [Planctomycetota bacterium]
MSGRAARPLEAVVWRRQDWRESSRLVTLLTRERGRVVTLAKGAHRSTSALLGRIDFLNRLEVRLAGREVPLLGDARLLHEPRALREPRRFLTVSHLADVLDAAWIVDGPDPELFDLTLGAIALVERAPLDRLRVIVAGVELRLLAHLGALPALDRCTACGAAEAAERPLSVSAREGGLACRAHRPPDARTVSPAALARLRELAATPGRGWPTLPPAPAHGESLAILGAWLQLALDRRTPLRALALAT